MVHETTFVRIVPSWAIDVQLYTPSDRVCVVGPRAYRSVSIVSGLLGIQRLNHSTFRIIRSRDSRGSLIP